MQKEKAVGVIGCVFVLMTMLISGYATAGTNSQATNCNYYNVEEVDSIAVADVDLRGKTYVMTSAMQNISDEDLEFKTAARYIRNALAQKGYKQVDSKEHADLLIRLAYGAGDPQTTTSTFTYTTAPGYSYPVGWWWYSVPSTTNTQTMQKTNYTINLVLEAYDLKTPGKLPQIWKTTLTSTGQWERPPRSSDFRIILPDMIAAAVPYFGTNMRQSNVPVCSDGPMVIDIKKE